MTRTSACACSIIAAAGLLASAAAAQLVREGGRPFTVQLTGAAERPGPGDPDGTGTARLMLNPGQGRVCYQFTVNNIAAPTAAHIHRAPPTDPGPVVVPLPPGTTLEGCTEDVSRELIMDIIQNPEDFYVNIHNTPFPAGAIRGQLSK